MSVPLSQVKPICTSSELALVRASRAPELEYLTTIQLKQHAQRARKLFDKWQDQSRSQSRTSSRQAGFPDLDTRSHLKVRIFSEALKSFEARLAKSPSAVAAATEAPSSTKPKKKVRAAKHRASRAEVRAELALAQATLNTKTKAPKKAVGQSTAAAKKPRTAKPSAAAMPAEPAAAQVKSSVKASTKTGRSRPPLPVTPVAPTKLVGGRTRQRAAITAAKQSRVARSGLTTRVRGHVSAHGKRSQARRDGKNS